jgi:lipid-binding SYLF domain-containing protein
LAPRVSHAQSRQDGIVRQAIVILDDLTATNRKGLPPLLLRHAQGVAIFPNMVKGAFLLGGRFGEGVILLRGPDGAWSYPIFVSLGGGSLGLQAGVQKTDLLLAFKNRQTIDSFFAGKGKLTLGVDGAVALGGIGRFGTVGTGVAFKSQYKAYSRSRGLFAGVSMAGSGMKVEYDAIANYYGRPLTPAQILTTGMRLPVPSSAIDLQSLLMAKTGLVSTGAVEGTDVFVVEDEPPVVMPGVRVEGVPPATGEVIVEDRPAASTTTVRPRAASPSPAPAPTTSEPPLLLEPIPPDPPVRKPATVAPPLGNPDDDLGPPTRVELPPPPAGESPLPPVDPAPPPASATRSRSRPAGSTAPVAPSSDPPSLGKFAAAESDMIELPRFDSRRRDPSSIPYSDTVPEASVQRASAQIVQCGRSGDLKDASLVADAAAVPALMPTTRKVVDAPPSGGRSGWRRTGASAPPPVSQDATGGFIARPESDSGVTRL